MHSTAVYRSWFNLKCAMFPAVGPRLRTDHIDTTKLTVPKFLTGLKPPLQQGLRAIVLVCLVHTYPNEPHQGDKCI